MLIWLLMQAAVADAPLPETPLSTLHGVVVDAIRNCVRKEGEITVCSRDRGFAEGQRLPKIKKPKPPEDGVPVKVQVTAGPQPPPDRPK